MCCAEELAGKLERIDFETVTLIGSDNRKVDVRVDMGNRHKAAPFLGKTVTVDVTVDKGECRAVRFRSVK
jgi:predicted thioesterase